VRYAALLRGINVGGKNLVPMKDLVAVFEKAGAREVVAYIQSGNVVFSAAAPLVKKLPALVEKAVEARFGCRSPVIVRSHDELKAIAGNNPFSHDDPRRMMVMFLAGAPRNVDQLDKKRSPPDRFEVRGREIFLLLPNGFGRSKLTNDYFDRVLETVSTGRNWNTVLKLVEMTGTKAAARGQTG
jgi:uncharacterized protein (DUF1697 family)